MRLARPKLKTLLWLAVTLFVAALWSVTLRPSSLGGPAGYVMIRGASMQPTYVTGDLVITHKAQSYKKGDIVAYRVPKGDFGEGIIVIHRIIGGSAAEGFVIQGDNNGFRDDWYPKPSDIVGKAWVRLPLVGTVLGFLHAPLPMASVAASIAIVFVLFPEDKKKKMKLLPQVVKEPVVAEVLPYRDVYGMLPFMAQMMPRSDSASSSESSSPRMAA